MLVHLNQYQALDTPQFRRSVACSCSGSAASVEHNVKACMLQPLLSMLQSLLLTKPVCCLSAAFLPCRLAQCPIELGCTVHCAMSALACCVCFMHSHRHAWPGAQLAVSAPPSCLLHCVFTPFHVVCKCLLDPPLKHIFRCLLAEGQE